MTKRDLFDWAINKGCESIPMGNNNAPAVFLYHEENNTRAIFNTQRMEQQADEEFICMICLQLRIEIPNYGKKAIETINKLRN